MAVLKYTLSENPPEKLSCVEEDSALDCQMISDKE